ncbi:DNA-binding protein H-NS [Nicoletella semolina]|uniref:DNA-binding protein n=1 Tax=Nicoletella semolina TaxID=271160 RepID=A0A4R2N985_9PAST|nr:H-NS family nucleoid-associated regulatory protein [Nicoletella semolina]MDH2925499.1 DNA-binding protein H-NS-like protein [Nicoletella semolina]TCP17574.1 DNA-binding protein H-NS [Nicoletella semolina]
MSEVLRTLSNIRSLRVIARESTLEQMEELLNKITAVVEEKREAAKIQEAENLRRLESLKKFKALLDEDGISLEELASLFSGSAKGEGKKRDNRQVNPARYKYVNDKGQYKTWTGQGRMPLTIQRALDEGKSLAEFEI